MGGVRARPADNRLGRAEWQAVRQQLLVRSGGLCEARTVACLAAPSGGLGGVAWSVHHRKPRGMGGTTRADVHAYHHLLAVCGDGVRGCHGHIEGNREQAYRRGLLLRQGDDGAAVPVELASGRLVLLDPGGGFYRETGWRIA